MREAQECIARASSAVREDRDFLGERTSKLRATGEAGVSHMYGVRRSILGRRNTHGRRGLDKLRMGDTLQYSMK